MTLRHVGLLVLASLLAFCNTFQNELHLDDSYRVEHNPGVQRFWPPWRHFVDPTTSARLPRLVQYRPLLPLTLSINYAIAGDSVTGYHVGNLLFQIVAAVLVYFLCRELLHWVAHPRAPLGALLAALLFAVHPVAGYLVNYVCSRDLLLMQVFQVAALLAYVRMRRLGETPGRWAGGLLLLLLALLAKQNAVAFPALVALFELLFTTGPVTRLWRMLPSAGLIGGFLLFVRFGLGFSDLGNIAAPSVSEVDYAWHQLQHHVFHYLRNFIWPFAIRAGAADPLATWRSVAGAACLAASWVLAWRWRRTRPLLTFCVLGYQILMALTSSLLPLHDEVVGYRPYAGSMFVFLALASVLAARAPGRIVLAVAVVYLAGASLWFNRTWRTDRTLWQHAVDRGGSARVYYNLAMALPDGDPEKRSLFLRTIELSPSYITGHIGFGMMQIRTGEPDAGIARLRHAVALDPERAQSYYWLAEGLHQAGQHHAATDAAVAAVGLHPENATYRYAAGRIAFAARRPATMLEHLLPLQARHPDHYETVYLIAVAYQMQGRNEDAIRNYQHYLARNPGATKLHEYIAQCYDAAGEHDLARKHRAHARGSEGR